MSKRVFVALTGIFNHPKYGDKYRVVAGNRKMFMPLKYIQWQGKMGLFGGGLEKGESLEQGALRELQEEVPAFPLPKEEDLILVHKNEDFALFAVDLGAIDQGTAQLLGGCCTEGLVDFLDDYRLDNMPEVEFIYPSFKGLLKRLLAR